MQFHVEVVEGRREGPRLATIQRCADSASGDGLGIGIGIGLTLIESKGVLERLQAIVVREHADELVACPTACGGCKRPLARKGASSIVYRTAFGKLNLQIPRLYSQCRCRARACGPESFNSLATHSA